MQPLAQIRAEGKLHIKEHLIAVSRALLSAQKCLPPAIEFLKPSQVDVLGKILRERLLSKGATMVKSCVQTLVDEVLINNHKAVIRRSHAGLSFRAAPNENWHFCSSAHIHIRLARPTRRVVGTGKRAKRFL